MGGVSLCPYVASVAVCSSREWPVRGVIRLLLADLVSAPDRGATTLHGRLPGLVMSRVITLRHALDYLSSHPCVVCFHPSTFLSSFPANYLVQILSLREDKGNDVIFLMVTEVTEFLCTPVVWLV